MNNDQAQRVVWGIGTSRTLRVHWALAELALDYRTERIQTRTPDTESERFQSVNPRRKIPVLEDGAVRIAESGAIVTYLGETYGGERRPLVPATPARRARYFEWLMFIAMELDATSLYVIRRHAGLAEIYGEAPVAVRAAEQYFARMIESAAKLFGDKDQYLLGDSFTGADIMLVSTLNWAVAYRQPIPDVFEAYRRRALARSSYGVARQANKV